MFKTYNDLNILENEQIQALSLDSANGVLAFGQTHRLTFSKDGTTLILTRGTTSQDVVLLKGFR